MSLDPDGLVVDELEQADAAELAPEPALLDAAERQAWIRLDLGVDEAAARVETLSRDGFAALELASEHRGPEAIAALIGDRDRLVVVAHAHDRGDGPKQLLVGRGHARAHVVEQRGGVVRTGARRQLATERELRARRHAAHDLIVQ